MNSIKRFFLILIVGCSAFSETSWAQINPEGIYAGTMSIKDGTEHEVPLQLSLAMSGEVEVVDGVERQIIDSSFLIDDEGGPFGFSTVRLNLEANIIELSYLRPQVSNIANTPSFQLKGRFNDQNELQGEVFSGRFGLIGTFKLAKSDQKMLILNRKYQGRWVGRMNYLPEDAVVPFEITMAESYVPTVNPTDYEFEYTRGKASGYAVGKFPQSFTHTFIDYLHHKAFLMIVDLNGDTSVSVEMNLGSDGKAATGSFNSIFGGQRGTFVLNKADEVSR